MPVASPPTPSTTGARRTRAERLALLEPLLARRILAARRGDGHDDPDLPPGRGGLPGRALRRLAARAARATATSSRSPSPRSSAPSTPPTSTPARTSSRPTPSPATRLAQADYGLEDLVYELNHAGAALARAVADEFEAQRSRAARASWPACSARPTAPRRISPDVNDPGLPEHRRSTSWWRPTREAARGLLDGGADLLLIETIFDTLNAKAAIFAVESVFESLGCRVPVMISGTITDASGRTLSGQTTEAFWNSVAHARPLSVGLNCALGAAALRPVRAGALPDRAGAGEHPSRTPGCPTSSASTTRRPRRWRRCSASSRSTGW